MQFGRVLNSLGIHDKAPGHTGERFIPEPVVTYFAECRQKFGLMYPRHVRSRDELYKAIGLFELSGRAHDLNFGGRLDERDLAYTAAAH